MKLNNIFATALMLGSMAAASAPATAQEADPWMHLYYKNTNGLLSFPMEEILQIGADSEEGNVIVTHADKGDIVLPMGNVLKWSIGANVPRLDITTDSYIYEFTSKTDYVSGKLKVSGHGLFEDLDDITVLLRGRGNSTWSWPKKAYRMKFESKQKLCGFKKAKNYVLLANYMDRSLMRNFAAYKFGELIEQPWINHIQPVDVYLNGGYKGSYMLTEKVGINAGSVDLSTEDEAMAALYELDTNTADYDEHPFTSTSYSLPVRIKDPDVPEDYTMAANWVQTRKNWFNAMETAVKNGGDEMWDYVDLESLVRYVMCFNIACNQELNHPKSVYLYTVNGGKFEFGPIWDFDWAYGFDPMYTKTDDSGDWGWGGGWGTTYPSYENPLLGTGDNEGHGGEFFLAMCRTERFLTRYAEVWNDFYTNHIDEFWAAFEEYAETIEPTSAADKVILTYSSTYHEYLTTPEALREWLQNRFEYINNPDNNYGLWQ